MELVLVSAAGVYPSKVIRKFVDFTIYFMLNVTQPMLLETSLAH